MIDANSEVLSVSRKVMGVKLTEDLRSLAQFFMKQYPLDVNQRHIKRPKLEVYHACKFSAIIGGICTSTTEILDKILVANSLLDNAKQIFLCGEVGIAGLSALGIKVGRVERRKTAELQFKDYAKLTPFFTRLFEKAAQKGVMLILPHDVQTAPKFLPKGYNEKPSELSMDENSKQLKEEKKTEDVQF